MISLLFHFLDSFAIDSTFGTIRTSKILDHEMIAFYNLTITATDGGTPALSSSIFVVINVQDINDNQPIFSKPSYSGVVSENATFGTEIVQVCMIVPNMMLYTSLICKILRVIFLDLLVLWSMNMSLRPIIKILD